MYTHGDELNRFDSFFQGKEAFKNPDIVRHLITVLHIRLTIPFLIGGGSSGRACAVLYGGV
jgi:hypothetical protein